MTFMDGINQTISLVAIWALIIFNTTVYAGPLDISDVPLELTPAVAPNILIVSDDSESMDWEILTQDITNDGVFFSAHLDGTDDLVNQIVQRLDDGDGAADGDLANSCFNYAILRAGSGGSGDYVDGYSYIVAFPSNQTIPIDNTILPNDAIIKNCYIADDEAWRARSYTFNKLYFDPNKTYVPWAGVDINGNPYANADIQNTPDDPYDPQNFIDLTLHKSGLALDGVSRISGDGFAYYEWVDANNDGVAQNDEEPPKILIKTAFQASTKTYPLSVIEANDVVQNFANWFTYYRKREFVAKALISHSVANNSSARVGHATINQNSTTSIRVKFLNQSLLTGNKKDLLDAIGATNSSGSTPLRDSYEKAGEYFRCNANDIFGSGASSPPGDVNCPYTAAPAGSCQVSSSFLLTDGFGNGANASIVTTDEDSGGATITDFDGGAFADGVNNTLADIAMFYYEGDAQNSLTDDVPVTGVDLVRDPNSTPVLQVGDRLHQHLNTNVVGIFNSTGITSAEVFPSDATATFSWETPGTFQGRVDDLKHAAYNGRGGFFSALSNRDFPDIINSIDSAFSTAATTPGSTTSITFNTQSIAQDSLVFRTFSNLATNSGDLAAQEVNVDGTLKVDPVTKKPIFIWSAAEQLPSQSSRLILTYDDSSTPSGKLFLSGPANGLTAAQETALEDNTDPVPANVSASDVVDRRIAYLRGDSSNEGVNFDNGEMRVRAPIVENAQGINTGGKIGDIVHSSPVFVGEPPFANRFGGAYPSTEGNTYFEYVTANSSRDELVFAGANDGMLHAFQAADGVEKFAYIPNILLSEIPEYTKPEYSHQFYVDSTPSINDVFIDPRPVSGSSREWRTVLVNGLGAGGKGYFALDITDPADIGTDSVMWEFTDSDDDNLGLTYSRPIIAMSNDASSGEQRWVAIFGNGFNNASSSGNASLYILFLDAGYNGWSSGDFIEIDTGVGTSADGVPNGIGGVTGIDADGNGTVDRLYAGDLQGNLYVFDISSSSTGSWNLEKTLFQANYTTSVPDASQPITTQPTVIANPAGGFIVTVGTGSYFTNVDATSKGIQSIYGLWDNPASSNNSTITHTGLSSELVEQTFTTSIATVNGDDIEVRTGSSNDVIYNDDTSDAIPDVRGWYIDFDIAPPNGTGIQYPGERAVRNLQLRNNQLFFSTVIPQDGTSCDPSPGGFGLSVNPLDGGVSIDIIFDINIDGVFDLNDNILISSVSTVISGTRFKSAPSDSTFIGDYRLTQLSDTSIDSILVNPDLNGGGGLGALLGRHSWKEIR